MCCTGKSHLEKLCQHHNDKPISPLPPHTDYVERKGESEQYLVHWDLCKMNGLEHTENWYEHISEGAVELEKVKVLSDINVQSDNVIEAIDQTSV